MIVPGKDDNYPGGSSGTSATQGAMTYLPHGILGITLAAIVILFAFHLMKGGRRRR